MDKGYLLFSDGSIFYTVSITCNCSSKYLQFRNNEKFKYELQSEFGNIFLDII